MMTEQPQNPNPDATETENDATVLGGSDTPAEATEQGADQADDATDEGTTAETANEAEGEASEAAVPETYTLSTPDGFEAIDTEVLAEATPVFQELGLTNEQADKLTPIAAALVKKTMDRAEAAITDRAITQRKEWNDAFEADAEIGGTNKDATIAAAARAFDHYGLKKGEGLRQLLDESGLGNHPDMIRFVSRIGRDIAEGSFERGDAVSQPKAPEQKLYGAEFQPKG
jgi:hypothetical protein